MKNLFFVFVIFFSGTSYTVNAQKSLRFIDGIQINAEKRQTTIAVAPKTIANKQSGIFSATELCKFLQFKYAQLTDQEVEAVSNISLYKFIDDWYNTRYRMGGCTKRGIDCSSFTSRLMDAVYGQCLPRTSKEQYHSSDRINRNELKEGDLVFFNTRGRISHVGVYLTNGYFVHSSSSNGVSISSMDESYYEERYAGAGRTFIPADVVCQ